MQELGGETVGQYRDKMQQEDPVGLCRTNRIRVPWPSQIKFERKRQERIISNYKYIISIMAQGVFSNNTEVGFFCHTVVYTPICTSQFGGCVIAVYQAFCLSFLSLSLFLSIIDTIKLCIIINTKYKKQVHHVLPGKRTDPEETVGQCRKIEAQQGGNWRRRGNYFKLFRIGRGQVVLDGEVLNREGLVLDREVLKEIFP